MKIRMRKKWMALPLATMVIAGCSHSETSNSASGSKDTIKIMAPLLSPESPSDKSPSLKALEKYTGKEIKVTWVPDSSYNDKFNIVMASGEMPHAIVIKDKSAGFIKSVKAGAFWELSPYLKDYKNLSQADEKILKNRLGERRGVRNLQNEGSDQGVYDHQNRLAEKCRSGYAGNA